MGQEDIIVGIDLGTTNSLVAVVESLKPKVLIDDDGFQLVPSTVTIAGQEFVVGRRAKDLALTYPTSTVFSVKRLMGRSFSDLKESELRSLPFEVVAGERGLAQIKIAGRIFMPEEISAMVLKELKDRASRYFGREVTKAVVTVPAYFDDGQRQATRLAGRLAGLEVVRIVNEPTAAALAYGLDRTKDGHVVIYDLGGGTFDVSVLEIREGIFRVRATSGDTQLGGDDFDRLVMEHLLKSAPPGFTADAYLLQALKKAAEQAKIELSDHRSIQYGVVDARSGLKVETVLERAQFEGLIAALVDKSLDCCRRALKDAALDLKDLRAVVLVGGSTRVPFVRRRVEEFFGRRPYTGIDPDLVVALGAALQADILSGKDRSLLLLDVLPLSLGLETYGGAVAKILMRNQAIPALATDTFTTYVDRQTAIDFQVLQGERELVKDCRSLARFRLRGLPPLPAGMVRVDVSFLVDENGILTVSAKERTTGVEAGIEVVPSYGLTDDQIARMVEESFTFARQDLAMHQLIDLRNECQTMVRATEKILAEGDHAMIEAQRIAIDEAIGRVRRTLTDPDPKVLKAAYDLLVEATVPLAGEVMSDVARKVVIGRTIDQVLEEPAREKAADARTSSDIPAQSVLVEVPAAMTRSCGDLGEGFRSAPPQTGGNAMPLKWTDAEEIGLLLLEKFPDVDPLSVRFSDLHRYVTELPEFSDDPRKSSEGILEAIQMAWYDESRD